MLRTRHNVCEWRVKLSKSASTGLDVDEVPGACVRHLGLAFAGWMGTGVERPCASSARSTFCRQKVAPPCLTPRMWVGRGVLRSSYQHVPTAPKANVVAATSTRSRSRCRVAKGQLGARVLHGNRLGRARRPRLPRRDFHMRSSCQPVVLTAVNANRFITIVIAPEGRSLPGPLKMGGPCPRGVSCGAGN